MKKINLTVASDKNMLIGMVVTLYTALKHINPEYTLDIHILNVGIKKNFKNRLKKSLDKLNKPYSINYVTINKSVFSKFKNGNILSLSKGHITKLCYARLLAPDLFPESIEKCIYLDCDTYVNTDISKIYDDISPLTYPVYAAKDPTGREEIRGEYLKRGLDPNSPYFNSGVLVMNLKKWRENNLSEACLNLVYQIQDISPDMDQSSLNIIFCNNWGELETKWNLLELNGCGLTKKNINTDAIIHYAGGCKPWRRLYNYEQFYMFYNILEETEWKGWKPPLSMRTLYLKLNLNLLFSQIKLLFR